MNYKTTLYLAVALVGCVLGWLVFKPPAGGEQTYQAPDVETGSVEKLLIEPDDYGDAVKVECRLKDQPGPWMFEKTTPAGAAAGAAAEWTMKAPFEAKAVGYQVDRITNQMTNLRYELSYDVEGGAVTLAQAGLDPPEAVVTVTDDAGKSYTVEIGRSAGRYETYVRLAGAPRFCAAKSAMKTLFNESAIEYRDQQLARFDSMDAQRLEIVHQPEGQDPKHYVLVRDGSDWVFESPFTGRATASVESAVQAFGGLRASNWAADDETKLALFGLDKPALIVKATVEEEVKAPDEDEDEPDESPDESEAEDEEAAEAEKPAKVTKVHEVHISQRGPIGEDQKVYARLAGQSAAALILKSAADRLTPIEKQWRDMSVTTAKTSRANRIELVTPTGPATLVKRGAQWTFEDIAAPAETESVTQLLSAIEGLKARGFDDYREGDDVKFGLDQPQAVVRLTVPGQDEVERLAIGGSTDEQTHRLVYVRRNESTSVAKVRAADVEPLVRGPLAYRDLTIFDAEGGTIDRITLTRENRYDESGDMALTFEPRDAGWRMTAPADAAVAPAFEDFVKDVRTLRGKAFVSDGPGADPAAYGLDDPSAVLEVTFTPPKTYKLEMAPEVSNSTQPPAPATGDEPGGDEAEGDDDDEDGGGVGGQDESMAVPGGDAAADDGRLGGPQATPPPPPPPGGDAKSGDPLKMVPVEVQLQARSVTIEVGDKDGVYYARNTDTGVIHELAKETFDKFFAEYREGAVFDFQESQVKSFTLREGSVVYTFAKSDRGDWTYEAEPDLALDRTKVQNLLVQIKGLKTPRYMRYGVEDLGAYKLAEPGREIAVTLDDGAVHAVLISDASCPADEEEGRYAAVRGSADVFLLSKADLRRLTVKMEELEAKE